MDKLWFISVNDVVRGPLTTTEAESELRGVKAESKTLVWWKGLSQWVSQQDWRSQRDTVLREREAAASGTKKYYFHADKDTEGPFSIAQMSDRMKTVPTLDKVFLWSDNKERWMSIFEYPNVCEALGITRRQHPRAPMQGAATINKEQTEVVGEVVSISRGGCGIRAQGDAKLTGLVSLTLRSPVLFNVIKTRAEITSLTADGVYNVKFLSLSSENQASIMQYVRRFEEEKKAVAA